MLIYKISDDGYKLQRCNGDLWGTLRICTRTLVRLKTIACFVNKLESRSKGRCCIIQHGNEFYERKKLYITNFARTSNSDVHKLQSTE